MVNQLLLLHSKLPYLVPGTYTD